MDKREKRLGKEVGGEGQLDQRALGGIALGEASFMETELQRHYCKF